MPNFTPNSIIRIGRVPFDNSYAHTMTFANSAAQASYFESVCTQALSRSDYTYVRMNNAIRVPYNAESLYTYNYVMYMNANYGNKWFYAFIVGINYVNENMTELVLELDVMQTWYFDYQLSQCFVEREHVNDDTVGKHLNPEPTMELQYIHEGFTQVSMSAGYVILMVNQVPTYKIDVGSTIWKPNSSTPISGGKYQNFFSGCKPIIFKTDAPGLTAFRSFLDALNEVGAADTIIDAYTVPLDSLNVQELTQLKVNVFTAGGLVQNKLADTWTLPDGASAQAFPFSVPKPTALNGYTPHNNKLFTYPYSYLEFGDFNGRLQDYRWEYFIDTARAPFVNKLNAISDCVGYVTPSNYNGVNVHGDTLTDEKSSEPFTYSFGNKISWTYGTYENWAAQNAVGNQLAVLGGALAVVGGIASGVNAIANARNAENIIDGGSAGSMINVEAGSAKSMIGGGLAAIAGTYANISRMSRHPNVSRGNTAGNSKFQTGNAGFFYSEMNLRAEFAEIADRFFDMYGYQVDIVKTPNRTGRPYWNYVKTANADMHGNVPADDMAKINSIYNSGITFWHTSDIGNYSLDNRLS